MARRKQTKRYLTSFPWQQIYTGLVVMALVGVVHMVPKPVPDTKGVEFLVSTALCRPGDPASLFVVPQTTEAVNVTITSLENKVYTIPQGGVLRQELPCTELEWGTIDIEGIFISTTLEVSLYIEYQDESHVVFPWDTLGLDYVMSTPIPPDMDETFVIISGNHSNVDITLHNNMTSTVVFQNQTFSGGDIINFTLGACESALISCNCDLSGAGVVATGAVSVLVGSRHSGTGGFIVDQLPPANIWGRRFIWPGHPWIAQNVTLKITGRPGHTTSVTVSLKDSSQTLAVPSSQPLTMQLIVSDFLAIESNASVLCYIMYDINDLSGNSHVTFRFLAPLLLYHLSSTFAYSTSSSAEMSANLILRSSSYQYISINKTQDIEFSKRPMTYYWNYFILRDVSIKSPFTIRTSDTNKAPFHSNVLFRSLNNTYDYPLGMRITGIYDRCVKAARAHGGNGDGVDNDCDNKIDEENLNSRDDDGDGTTDEDIVYSGVIKPDPGTLAWQYILKNREVDEGISSSVILVIISIVVSIMSVVCFIGGMLLADKLRRVATGTRVMPFQNHHR